MKKTLLTLMLVSSLFVISCGADATKPQDAYKSQTTETVTGTTTITASVSAGVVQDFVTTPGKKVTEIVQVVTVTTDTAGTTTTNTNAVTATKQNADGGIYQFTISDTTAQNAAVTYKYSKKAAAPTVVKEAKGTYSSTGSTLTINDVNFTDEEKSFDKNVVSVTDKYGTQLINGTEYTYYSVTDAVTIKKTGYLTGDAFTVKYSYRDISMISEKPLTGNVTITDADSGVGGGNATVTIPLDAALYAGRSCYLKAVITDTPTGSGGTPTPTTETIYYNKIVPSTGIIDITLTTITKPSSQTTTGTYEIWVY